MSGKALAAGYVGNRLPAVSTPWKLIQKMLRQSHQVSSNRTLPVQTQKFSPSINRIQIIMSGIVTVVGLLSVPMQLIEYKLETISRSLSDIARRFIVDTEGSVPAWYSSVLLLVASALLAVVATVAFNQQDRWWKHWVALSTMFCLLSIDEAFSFHESLILPLQTHFGAHGFFYFAWVIPGAFFVGAVGLMFLKFVLNLDTPTRNRFIIAGSVFVGRALGMECVGGAFIDACGGKHILYILASSIEETLEMLGVTLFIIAILKHLESRVSEFRLSFAPARVAQAWSTVAACLESAPPKQHHL